MRAGKGRRNLWGSVIVALALCAATIFAGPSLAGPPFRTDDPEPVDYQHWEIYGFSTATQIRDDFGGILVGTEVNYGAAPNLQLHAIVPLAFDNPTGEPLHYGLGDVELGTKYRFVDEDENGLRPQIGIFPLIEIPTGDAHRGLGGGFTRYFVPVWLQKSFDKWTTYGGGGYWIDPGDGNRDFWFVGWLLQRQLTDKLTLGGELFHQTADAVDASDSSGFNLGGFYDVTENHHILFSAGRNFQNATDTNQFSYYVGYQYTF